MSDSLYLMPHWAMGLLVVSATVAPSLAVYALFHKLLRPELTEEEVAAGPTFAGIIATVTSLLLAFTAVSVWDSFKSADQAVTDESTSATMLARDLGSFDSPAANLAREQLRGYLTSVVEKEWPLLAAGGVNEDSRGRLDEVFRSVSRIEPRTKREEVIAGEIWARTNELAKFRRERLLAARSHVPRTLWDVVLIGTFLTILCVCTLPPNKFGWSMIAAVSLSFGLVFFFIVAMDRPFAGRENVSAESIEETLANMTFWDKNTPAPAGLAAFRSKR
jgi:hypothetical protein